MRSSAAGAGVSGAGAGVGGAAAGAGTGVVGGGVGAAGWRGRLMEDPAGLRVMGRGREPLSSGFDGLACLTSPEVRGAGRQRVLAGAVPRRLPYSPRVGILWRLEEHGFRS